MTSTLLTQFKKCTKSVGTRTRRTRDSRDSSLKLSSGNQMGNKKERTPWDTSSRSRHEKETLVDLFT